MKTIADVFEFHIYDFLREFFVVELMKVAKKRYMKILEFHLFYVNWRNIPDSNYLIRVD